jgi:group I intron endonuclease
MQEEGLQNFSFEVLEKCPREQLDEKEKYYIELYQSIIYGYNILAGAISR